MSSWSAARWSGRAIPRRWTPIAACGSAIWGCERGARLPEVFLPAPACPAQRFWGRHVPAGNPSCEARP
ncbi:Uncharacterised protein [Bordetella pertussis]|nr:Uncharacterised protein [Bordetella pertussis]